MSRCLQRCVARVCAHLDDAFASCVHAHALPVLLAFVRLCARCQYCCIDLLGCFRADSTSTMTVEAVLALLIPPAPVASTMFVERSEAVSKSTGAAGGAPMAPPRAASAPRCVRCFVYTCLIYIHARMKGCGCGVHALTQKDCRCPAKSPWPAHAACGSASHFAHALSHFSKPYIRRP